MPPRSVAFAIVSFCSAQSSISSLLPLGLTAQIGDDMGKLEVQTTHVLKKAWIAAHVLTHNAIYLETMAVSDLMLVAGLNRTVGIAYLQELLGPAMNSATALQTKAKRLRGAHAKLRNKLRKAKPVNKALDFARFDDEIEVKSVGALRKLLARKPKEKELELLQMQIKIRKYVYKVFRPVPGAWLSGKKAGLVANVNDLVKLVEVVIKAESMEIGRRRPLVDAAPTRAANPFADDLTRQLDQK